MLWARFLAFPARRKRESVASRVGLPQFSGKRSHGGRTAATRTLCANTKKEKSGGSRREAGVVPAARGCHLLKGLQARISRPGLRCLLPRGHRPPPGSAGSSPVPIWAVLAPEHKDPLCPGSPAAFWFLVTLVSVLCTADPPWALTRNPSKNNPAAKGLGSGVGIPLPRARRPRGTQPLSPPRLSARRRERGAGGALELRGPRYPNPCPSQRSAARS